MTLTADTALKLGTGNSTINHYPVIGSDIIYSGSAVGLAEGTGYARPLTAGDELRGFANESVDNSGGSAGDLDVEVQKRGVVELSVTGAVITDVGQPVYATDENTFQFSPVGGSFVGFVARFISAGLVEVEFDVDTFEDPWGDRVRELKSANYTLDAEDAGKVIFVDTDAVVITVPATATQLDCVIANLGAYGTVGTAVSPNANDKIAAPNIAAADDTDLVNTKATAQRGDFVHIRNGQTDGPVVVAIRGTWAAAA